MKSKKLVGLIISLVLILGTSSYLIADYNRPWVKTQALYLNDTLVTATATELNVVDGVTAGTVLASKAVIVDSSKNIGDFNNLDAVNFDAGASGAAGTVDIFPATASRGKLTISCTNNSDNYGVTLTNAANSSSAKTITFPALTGYVGLSTAALSLAEMDVLDAVTSGAVTASKALVVDANKDLGDLRNLDVVNLDAGSSGTAGTIDVFPTTASHGKLIVAVTDQTGDTNVTLQVDAMGQATSVHVPDPGASASYVAQSTAALTLSEMDVLDAVTPGTVTASKALVVDASKDLATLGSVTLGTLTDGTATLTSGGLSGLTSLASTAIDAGASGAAGSVDIFPSTGSKGKVSITAADSAGDTTTNIVNASQSGARTYTIPDAGASAYFVMSTAAQSVAGTLTRADLTENALQAYGIPINQIMAADGAALGISETAGDFFLHLGTNFMELQGETSNNETEASVGYIQFILPPEYVAAGDVKLRLHCHIAGAGTDNGSTIDVEAYEMASGAVGADLCTTTAETFAAKTTYYDKDFTITSTGLVAGDILIFKITASVIENASSDLIFYSDPPKVLLDVKG